VTPGVLVLVALGADAELVVLAEPGCVPSAGHDCPGVSINFAPMADCICLSIEVPFVGLITPTIPIYGKPLLDLPYTN
jgi:hypothetical protein